MIHTSKQLKDKVRNLSLGDNDNDNDKAKMLIRNFMMERFLERVTLSKYRHLENLIHLSGVVLCLLL